jgi:hypothetical protein
MVWANESQKAKRHTSDGFISRKRLGVVDSPKQSAACVGAHPSGDRSPASPPLRRLGGFLPLGLSIGSFSFSCSIRLKHASSSSSVRRFRCCSSCATRGEPAIVKVDKRKEEEKEGRGVGRRERRCVWVIAVTQHAWRRYQRS